MQSNCVGPIYQGPIGPVGGLIDPGQWIHLQMTVDLCINDSGFLYKWQWTFYQLHLIWLQVMLVLLTSDSEFIYKVW